MIKVLVQTVPDNIPESVRYEPFDGMIAGSHVTGWFRISHVGKVLAKGERNWHDDSDFYAVVWNDEKNEPQEIGYATTRGWTYGDSATVDATDEVRAKADAWYAARAEERRQAREAAETATPRAGKTVRVVKGRKVPIGTVAEVTWYGPGKIFGGSARRQGTPPMRVCLRVDDDDRVFLDASNVQVISNVDELELDDSSAMLETPGHYAGDTLP